MRMFWKHTGNLRFLKQDTSASLTLSYWDCHNDTDVTPLAFRHLKHKCHFLLCLTQLHLTFSFTGSLVWPMDYQSSLSLVRLAKQDPIWHQAISRCFLSAISCVIIRIIRHVRSISGNFLILVSISWQGSQKDFLPGVQLGLKLWGLERHHCKVELLNICNC